MRQVGVLAAAGLHAVENNIQRLKEDHANAQRLAKGLADLGLDVVPADTNMVFWHVDNGPEFAAEMLKKGVHVLCTDGKRRCRAVPHLHVTSKDIDFVVKAAAGPSPTS